MTDCFCICHADTKGKPAICEHCIHAFPRAELIESFPVVLTAEYRGMEIRDHAVPLAEELGFFDDDRDG